MPPLRVESPKIWRVSQIAAGIKGLLGKVPPGYVEGEVRSINLQAKSGHCYLTLADAEASLSAIIWRGDVANCRPLPQPGDLIQAHYRKLDFYAARGSVSLILDRLKPTGEGELLRRREEVRKRLADEGLTDPARHPNLLPFPRRIGVIAGADSDAKVDVLRALRERFPPQDITFLPALVQGVSAPASVMEALKRLESTEHIDTIILARGGGSVSDLSAFDDEALCRAIFASRVPIITSIGHTQDRPNCDLVSAAYAPVPAKAAELAISYSAQELLDELERARLEPEYLLLPFVEQVRSASDELEARTEQKRSQLVSSFVGTTASLDVLLSQALVRLPRLDSLAGMEAHLSAAGRRAHELSHGYGAALARLADTSSSSTRRGFSRAEERLLGALELIEAKDWRRQGWILVSDADGRTLKTVSDLAPGEIVDLHFQDGSADAEIKDIHGTPTRH